MRAHARARIRARAAAAEKGTTAQNITFLMGLCPKVKNEWNNWIKHFYEMKGDVGMSRHEKERDQEDAYTKTKSYSLPHPYYFKTTTLFM